MLSNSAEAFDLLLHGIALQLLASCYTLLPASSASQLPLFRQKTEAKPVTALRLHSQHRFEPAAGHHARASSEAASWLGLHTAPTPEDLLAEAVSLQRRLKRSSDCITRVAASGWTDGSSAPVAHRTRGGSYSTVERTSSSEPGLFSRLICQAATQKIQGASRTHSPPTALHRGGSITLLQVPKPAHPSHLAYDSRL